MLIKIVSDGSKFVLDRERDYSIIDKALVIFFFDFFFVKLNK